MKKFKKMLAGLLGAAMVLTSFGTPAWAETKTPATTDATINTKAKGSITIHKYEYNGNLAEDIFGKYDGTGEATDKYPAKGEFGGADADAKPLEGAEFTIYKVKDAEGITEYYSKNPKELPQVNEFVEGNRIRDAYKESIVYVDASGNAVAKGTQGAKTQIVTTADGTASFTNLDVGFYVVIETKTPDKVTTPAAPFIVSVPMTKADGSDWLYDVHVYPKNKTTYGNVNLVKTGNGTEKLEGVTFVLQKKTNTNPISWTDVTASEQNPDEIYTLKTDNKGEISISGLSQGTYRFIETNRGSNGYIMDGATTYSFVVKEDGKTYNADGTALLANNTITVDNKKPDMSKQVQDRTKNEWQHDSDYNVGDRIPYKITIDVPKNITKLKEFTLTDTPKNLKDDITNIKVQYKEKGDSSSLKDVTDDTFYTVNQAPEEKGFKVTFTPAKMSTYAEKQIVITYSAELLSSAVKTTEGNPNTATLEYSNKIVPDTDDGSNPNKPGDTVGKDKIEDSTVVYTFKLKINKIANNVGGSPLSGVVFDLYKKVPNNTEGALTTEEASKFGFAEGTWKKVETLTTGEDGTIDTSDSTGYANGVYYLVETKTAKGYNLLKSPVTVKLNIAYTTTWTKTDDWTVDGSGNKTLVKHSESKSTFAAGGGATGQVTVVEENDTTTDGTMTETIINRKGFTLPKTGDIGTAMFLIIGIGGMLAAVYIMLRGRKRA